MDARRKPLPGVAPRARLATPQTRFVVTTLRAGVVWATGGCREPLVVHSVNGDRRPDLRLAILERNFQRSTCEACGASFRLDPDFILLDAARGRWIAARPAAALHAWQAREVEVRGLFDRAWGEGATDA